MRRIMARYRGGNGNGRQYTLTYAAADSSGNVAYSKIPIFVPHDQEGVAEPIPLSVQTNVAGTVISGTNCSTPTSNGTCATLFGASNAGSLMPGGADVTNTVTITYTGTVTPTSDFRLYSANYSSKLGSSPASCTAANPGSALDLQVSVGTLLPVVIYPTSGVGYGTIDGFATTYTSSANGLQLRGGTNGVGAAGVWATNDNSIFNIKVHLDGTAATNPYQGCQSQVDLVWFASQ